MGGRAGFKKKDITFRDYWNNEEKEGRAERKMTHKI
jgi:hypothetical protein